MRVKAYLCVFLLMILFIRNAEAGSPTVVISQVYGGGGNAGSTLKNDFVELFNRSAAAVSVDGWSIQYASAAGSTWDPTPLSGSIGPGQYYLVALAAGAGGSVNLPAGQATGSTNLSATQGKIALAGTAAALTGTCPTAVIDFVGYGGANCAEAGSPATMLSNTTALFRGGNGCADTDDNGKDFSTSPPAPRTAMSPGNPCGMIDSAGGGGPRPVVTGGSGGTTIVQTIGNAPLIFPHFAEGGGYQTTFALTNLSAAATVATISYFSQAGLMLASAPVSLGSSGSANVRTPAAVTTSALAVGWARITVAPAAELAATEIIQFTQAGVVVSESSVFPAQPDTSLRIALRETNGFGTGIALSNPSASDAALTLTIRSADGAATGTTNLTLPAMQQTARFASQFITAAANAEGTLEISANVPIAAFAVHINTSARIFSSVPISAARSEAYFSPGVGISSRIVQEIQRAQTSIDVAMYTFTRDEIADALIAAKNRGVAVRVLADSSETTAVGTDIPRLEAAGIPLKRTIGGGGGIMHNKFAVFDGRLLLTGSYNWTTAADQSNDENALFLRDSAVVSAYQTAFAALWAAR